MPVHFLGDRSIITKRVKKLFQNAEEIYCIVAFWGKGAEQLFDDVSNEIVERTRIVCNLTMGGTNPQVIRKLRDCGYQIGHNPALHSKVYWTDKGIVVGSANASANGLSLEGLEQGGWLESAIYSNHPSEICDVKTYVEEIWGKSQAITDDDLKKAEREWRNRRPFPRPEDDLSLAEALKRGNFTGRKNCVFIVVDTEEHSKEGENHIAAQDERLNQQCLELGGRETGAWSCWNCIPRNEFIVNFYYGVQEGNIQKRLYYWDLWKTLPPSCDDKGPKGDSYQYAYKVEKKCIGITGRQLKDLKKFIQFVISNHPEKNWAKRGCCINMDQLLEKPYWQIVENITKN